ncbi:MAG: hypothetical protein B6I19_00055 [Bacteroidetes bacterium 4572_114]|nr:MAG: hypothetical protein B6I19_00055 [Bacteroidetes bacterium 4572_114]
MNTNKYMVFLFFFVIGSGFSFGLSAQECKFYFPTEEGTLLEMTNYDKKGKVSGYTSQKILEKNEVDGALIVVFEQSSRDAKGKNEVKSEMEVRCEDGKFYFDLDNYMNDMNMEEYEGNPDMDVIVDGEDIYYPAELNVGGQLPDGSVTVKVLTNGFPMMTVTVNISNRKVVAKETITTPAGTFECHKLTQNAEVKAVMKMTTSEVTWLAEDIGIVKTEIYNKKGKLISSSELTKIEK